MMASPDSFIEFGCRDKSYKELIKIRDQLMRSVRRFENGRISEKEKMRIPSPDTVYQMNLEYLSSLCKLIAEEYNRQFIQDEEEYDKVDWEENSLST